MGTAFDSAQVESIVRTPSRSIRHSPRVNVEKFSPSRYNHSSFPKRSRNIELFNTSIDESPAQERNPTPFFTGKSGVKCLPGEVVTDLDLSKRMNFASSIFVESPKLMDFGLSSINATGKPKFVLASSTRAEILNRTEGGGS